MKYNIDDLILLNMAGIGSVRLNKLISFFGSIENTLKASQADLERLNDIGPKLARKISRIRYKEGLKKEEGLIGKNRAAVLALFDDAYPENLKNIYDPPLLLYVKGDILPEDKIAVSIVGSRKASLYGINICQEISQQLAGFGVAVISGLARGIDSAAHRGALKSGGRTLAVLGNGLDSLYPRENRRLAEEIARSGALISEFPMEMPPMRQNFPIRNRIISGLSLGVVVVEAARKSGALITAACALDQGREVFAVPGKAGTATAMGTHGLIKEGARLAESADDIIDELNLAPIGLDNTRRTTSGRGMGDNINRRSLTNPQKKIYNILSDEPIHVDDLIDKSTFPAVEVTRLLLELEIKKLVRELPGKNFVK
ncbi:MAG: DNA-protecting protein DprA [Candidatus Omnitrophica bacterium]|nr:DNA-protecting protein DprA [Candidatus Omnitrophota bacterium]